MHQIKKMFTIHTWTEGTTIRAQCLEIPELITNSNDWPDVIGATDLAIKKYLKNKLNNELNNDKVKVDDYLKTLVTLDKQIVGNALYAKGGFINQHTCFCNGKVDPYVSEFLIKLYKAKVELEMKELAEELVKVSVHEMPSGMSKDISFNHRINLSNHFINDLTIRASTGLDKRTYEAFEKGKGLTGEEQTNAITDSLSNSDPSSEEKIETNIGEIIRTGESKEDSINAMLYEYLVLWMDLKIPAPVNELQSIQGWLRHLGDHGLGATKAAMRKRMILLQNAAMDLHSAGMEAEDKIGIYQNVNRDKFEVKVDKPKFTVSIAIMEESSGTSYFVRLRNNELRDLLTEEQRKGIMFLDPKHGVIDPFHTSELEHANQEAKEWADFLQVSFTPYVEGKNND